MTNTIKLVSAVEMNARFVSMTSLRVVLAERDFYDFLLLFAGQEIEARGLVLALTAAMKRHSRLLPINMNQHLEAMVGDPESPVLKEAQEILEGAAQHLAEKHSRVTRSTEPVA